MKAFWMSTCLLPYSNQKNRKIKVFWNSFQDRFLFSFVKKLWRKLFKPIRWKRIYADTESLGANYKNSARLLVVFMVNVAVLVWQINTNPSLLSLDLENDWPDQKALSSNNDLRPTFAPVYLANSPIAGALKEESQISMVSKNKISNAIFPQKGELCQKHQESQISSNNCEEKLPSPVVRKTAVKSNLVKAKKVSNAKKPVDYKEVSGRLVCAKSHDKPGKSKKGKKTHMDMECCLDPDEIPNPHCHYSGEKYGNLLSKYYEKSKKKK